MDFSPDGFSKATAVYATEDPTWAMAYAIRTAACRRFLNACFYPAAAADWRQRRIFLSYASVEGRAPTAPGVVYAVPREGFTRMPSYRDPGLGRITECQWIRQEPVAVAAEIPVAPANLPLEPLLHDCEEVGLRSARDPHGFPWTG